MTPPHPTQPPSAAPSTAAIPSAELEEELATFRREWLAEQQLRKEAGKQQQGSALPSSSALTRPLPSSPPRPRASNAVELSTATTDASATLPTKRNGRIRSTSSVGFESQLEGLKLDEVEKEPPRSKPKSALEIYEVAVACEREGRLNDALSNYRHAFRLDPDIDKAYHKATTALQKAPRGSEPREPLVPSSHGQTNSHDFTFERTIQVAPDYEADAEHRSIESVEKYMGAGSGHEDNTHPSSTAFLFDSLVRSIASNPFQRDGPSASEVPTSQPPVPKLGPMSKDEALATLAFIPADPEEPLPISTLPREILVHILHIVALTSINPPPRTARIDEAPAANADGQHPKKGKRGPKRKTLREETELIELDLELQDVDRAWQSDVEALERFARTCRMGRILTLDTSIWRDLCMRTYVPPHQIGRSEDATTIVKMHGNDWRRCYIEHPRLRFDGCYISVVTYLRRGESNSWYAPSHIITFYRYLRFYASGLAISLLTTDAPGSVVRQLNPAMRVKGLTFGRWRLRGEAIELWGLEDPAIDESRRKYSFRMECRLRSTGRGRMNKIEMLSMATEHRLTLEQIPVPIRPTKPFFFSKVASYSAEYEE